MVASGDGAMGGWWMEASDAGIRSGMRFWLALPHCNPIALSVLRQSKSLSYSGQFYDFLNLRVYLSHQKMLAT